MGRPEAIYVYNDNGRGPCWIFEGPKSTLFWFRNFLAVSSPLNGGKVQQLTIYDLKNKVIAHSGSFQEASHVLEEWGSLVIVPKNDGTEKENGTVPVQLLVEKDIQAKTELLLQRGLFSVALNLAKGHSEDPSVLAKVQKRYGDYLYEKQEYEEAMVQYAGTIGYLECSYVIQKYVEGQRIGQLTLYLEKAHELGLSDPNLTTLLLNCYTKLKVKK